MKGNNKLHTKPLYLVLLMVKSMHSEVEYDVQKKIHANPHSNKKYNNMYNIVSIQYMISVQIILCLWLVLVASRLVKCLFYM